MKILGSQAFAIAILLFRQRCMTIVLREPSQRVQRAKVVVQDPASKVIRTGAGITLNKYIDIHLDGGDQCSNFPAYSWLQVCNIALQQELEVL